MINRAFDDWCKDINKRPALAVTYSLLWVVLICGIAFFWHLGSIGLIDETEPLFAEASRQMLVRHDWITPFFNDETRFDKPALIYWFQAIGYLIIGVSEWAVRIPSALAATAVVGLSFYTMQWYFLKKDELKRVMLPTRRWLIPSLAAAMIALSPEMIVWGRTGVSDMLLTGCIASALLCFFLGYANEDGKREKGEGFFPSKWYLAFYVLIAGAILTKGPVGIVLPSLIIAAFLLYVGKFIEVVREIRIIPGLLIIFGLSAPWYVLVIWRNGSNYINSFFGYHNIERFTEVVNGHQAPWFFYFIVVLLGFAPYSVYLPSAMLNLKFWQRENWISKTRIEQFSLFALIWFVVIFGFFSIAVTKLPSYVLPLMPAAAILVALLWDSVITSPNSGLRISAWINIVFVSVCSAALFYVPKLIGYDPAAPNYPQLLQQSNVTVIGGIIWLVCAVVLGFFLIRKNWVALLGANLIAFTLFIVFALMPALFIVDSERQLPLRKLSAVAVQNIQPQEELIMVGFKKPSVAFYTRRSVNYIRTNKAAGEYILNKPAKADSSSVLVLTQPKKFVEMGLQPTDYKILGDSGAYQLVRVPLKN
jgi:4-amino-4-deoxy-L-arabinose transferase-like glycosyltransferase